jgi:transposase
MEMLLRVREWRRPGCDSIHHRDINAALAIARGLPGNANSLQADEGEETEPKSVMAKLQMSILA